MEINVRYALVSDNGSTWGAKFHGHTCVAVVQNARALHDNEIAEFRAGNDLDSWDWEPPETDITVDQLEAAADSAGYLLNPQPARIEWID